MSRDEATCVADMVEACDRVMEYTAGLNAASFRGDRKTIDAVVRNLEVLGEASKRVSDRIRSQAPDVPWREIAGLRDVLIHDYFGIDLDIVCDVALLKVPRLRCVLDDVLRLFGGPGTTKA